MATVKRCLRYAGLLAFLVLSFFPSCAFASLGMTLAEFIGVYNSQLVSLTEPSALPKFSLPADFLVSASGEDVYLSLSGISSDSCSVSIILHSSETGRSLNDPLEYISIGMSDCRDFPVFLSACEHCARPFTKRFGSPSDLYSNYYVSKVIQYFYDARLEPSVAYCTNWELRPGSDIFLNFMYYPDVVVLMTIQAK